MQEGDTPNNELHITRLLSKVVERIEMLYGHEDQDEIAGITTGFTDLDNMISGLQPGDLVVVAGEPYMGKTAFAVNITAHVALELKKPVVFFSMGRSGAQLAMQMISTVGAIDQHTLRTGRLENDDWSRMTHALEKLHDAPIFIDETAALDALELRSRTQRLCHHNDGLGLIVIDCLQLMSSPADLASKNRATQNLEIVRSLKALARELVVPVIVLSQLRRKLKQRPNKRPVISDLREIGPIEQDADMILFIYRDEAYNLDSPDKSVTEIIIGKQGNRRRNDEAVKLIFHGKYARFDNYYDG